MEMPSRPLAIVRMSCRPRGHGKRNATTMTTNISCSQAESEAGSPEGVEFTVAEANGQEVASPEGHSCGKHDVSPARTCRRLHIVHNAAKDRVVTSGKHPISTTISPSNAFRDSPGRRQRRPRYDVATARDGRPGPEEGTSRAASVGSRVSRWATTSSNGDLPSRWRRASLSWNSIRMSLTWLTGLASHESRRRLPGTGDPVDDPIWTGRSWLGVGRLGEPGIDQTIEGPVHQGSPHRDHAPHLGIGLKCSWRWRSREWVRSASRPRTAYSVSDGSNSLHGHESRVARLVTVRLKEL